MAGGDFFVNTAAFVEEFFFAAGNDFHVFFGCGQQLLYDFGTDKTAGSATGLAVKEYSYRKISADTKGAVVNFLAEGFRADVFVFAQIQFVLCNAEFTCGLLCHRNQFFKRNHTFLTFCRLL